MRAKIVTLPGDGVGPEVTAQAAAVLNRIADCFGHVFEFEEALIGGCAIDTSGQPLPEETLARCRRADAALLGAVGGPKWDDPHAAVRPEQGLLDLRRALGVYANLRPVRVWPGLDAAAPLKAELLRGVDLMVVRELTGGLYFGRKEREPDRALDTCVYSAAEIERVARVACRLAADRRGRLVSVDKANVLETSRLWRATVARVVAEEFPRIRLEHMLVDAAAMRLIQRPADFDVILTENMFGDILTDEASVLAGSLGLLPSASLGDAKPGLFEPVHGSAPDIAGLGVANPYGAIGSAAMLLRHGLGLEIEGQIVEDAVSAAIAEGALTPELAKPGKPWSDTAAVGEAVCARIEEAAENAASGLLNLNISALGA